MPVPTTRALWLAALSLVPAVVALLSPSVAPLLIAFDVALIALIAIDFALAPRAGVLALVRSVEPVLSSGRVNVVRIELASARAVTGELRDWVTPGPSIEGQRARFEVDGVSVIEWRLTPSTRGEGLAFTGRSRRLPPTVTSRSVITTCRSPERDANRTPAGHWP